MLHMKIIVKIWKEVFEGTSFMCRIQCRILELNREKCLGPVHMYSMWIFLKILFFFFFSDHWGQMEVLGNTFQGRDKTSPDCLHRCGQLKWMFWGMLTSTWHLSLARSAHVPQVCLCLLSIVTSHCMLTGTLLSLHRYAAVWRQINTLGTVYNLPPGPVELPNALRTTMLFYHVKD